MDAYAWALHLNGEHAEAWAQIEKALTVGIRDAKIFYHAGAIAADLGDLARAQEYWRESVSLNPHSEVAELVREKLSRLSSSEHAASHNTAPGSAAC